MQLDILRKNGYKISEYTHSDELPGSTQQNQFKLDEFKLAESEYIDFTTLDDNQYLGGYVDHNGKLFETLLKIIEKGCKTEAYEAKRDLLDKFKGAELCQIFQK